MLLEEYSRNSLRKYDWEDEAWVKFYLLLFLFCIIWLIEIFPIDEHLGYSNFPTGNYLAHELPLCTCVTISLGKLLGVELPGQFLNVHHPWYWPSTHGTVNLKWLFSTRWVLKCLMSVSRWGGHGLCPRFVPMKALFHQNMGQVHWIFYVPLNVLLPLT